MREETELILELAVVEQRLLFINNKTLEAVYKGQREALRWVLKITKEPIKEDNKMQVEFKFDLDQRVITPFGDQGIITMLGVDDGGSKYYVQTKSESQWFKEKEITV